MSDSEYEKALVAEQCKRDRSFGFEGCKRCGDGGFYCQTYSREGYCRKCELECFPARFYPCIHCRVPHDMQMGCLFCEGGCKSWVKKTQEDCSDTAQSRNNNHELLCKGSQWHDMANELTRAGDHDGRYVYSRGWPGFYMGRDAQGKHFWKKLPYLPKVLEGGICVEEPWYMPSWKTLEELSAIEWKRNSTHCWLCDNVSFLHVCKKCAATYCNEMCAERDGHACGIPLIECRPTH